MSGPSESRNGPPHLHTVDLDPNVRGFTFGYDINALLQPHVPRFDFELPEYDDNLDEELGPSSPSQTPSDDGGPYFYDDGPSPSTPTFLDTILNPVEPQNQNPVEQRAASPPRLRRFSPIVSIQNNMPARHREPRPARLPSGYVDLTGPSESPEAQRRPIRLSTTPGPSGKRRKQNDGTKTSTTPETKVEEMDLTDDKQTVQDVLQKQREDAVKAQKPEEAPTTFTTFTCVICMDTPTDLTATACGHLFCHTCLMEALIAGENRAGPGEPRRSQCPVCRKNISRNKASDITPLLLKKGLATQPRKKAPVAVEVSAAPGASKVTS